MTSIDAARPELLGGRYQLGELIGRGGMGSVWAATDEVLHRQVAIKEVLAPNWVSEQERASLCERTQREARAAARINHPNVVTVFDVITEDNRPWIVMEKIDGPSLAKVIDLEGPMSARRVANIGVQMLAALRAAHERGILHRDVKPGNVLVCAHDRAVLTDFGIATVDGDVSLTVSGVLVGAPGYIAPERARGLPFGAESDLWALAATLYAAAEGKAPFDRTGVLPTLTAVLTEEPDPMELGGPLAPVLTAMLRKEPADRPSAAEFERLLRAVMADAAVDQIAAGVSPARVAASPARLGSVARAEPTRIGMTPVVSSRGGLSWWQRSGPITVALSAAVLVSAAVLAIVFSWQPNVNSNNGPAPQGNQQVHDADASHRTTTRVSRTSDVSGTSSSTSDTSATSTESTTSSSSGEPTTSSSSPTPTTTPSPPTTTTTTVPTTTTTVPTTSSSARATP